VYLPMPISPLSFLFFADLMLPPPHEILTDPPEFLFLTSPPLYGLVFACFRPGHLTRPKTQFRAVSCRQEGIIDAHAGRALLRCPPGSAPSAAWRARRNACGQMIAAPPCCAR